MAQQAGTPGAGFFYRLPAGTGGAGAPVPPAGGNGRRFTGKQLLLAFVSGGFAIGYLTWGGHDETKQAWAPAHFAHPVRVKGTAVEVLTEPRPEASAIASISSTDSVENIGRLNDQWSQVQLHDGREGFVSNEFLEGVPYVPLAATAVAATALAPSYSSGARMRERTMRRENRRLRQQLSRRPASSYIATAPTKVSGHPTPTAPSYSATYSTAGSASGSYHSSRESGSSNSNSSSPSYRYHSSGSYYPTYSAPRVNYTFRSRSRSLRRRR